MTKLQESSPWVPSKNRKQEMKWRKMNEMAGFGENIIFPKIGMENNEKKIKIQIS